MSGNTQRWNEEILHHSCLADQKFQIYWNSTNAYRSSPRHGVSVWQCISRNFQLSTCQCRTVGEGRGFPIAMENVVKRCWVSFKQTELLFTVHSGRLGSRDNKRIFPSLADSWSGAWLVWSELAMWSYRKLLNLKNINKFKKERERGREKERERLVLGVISVCIMLFTHTNGWSILLLCLENKKQTIIMYMHIKLLLKRSTT